MDTASVARCHPRGLCGLCKRHHSPSRWRRGSAVHREAKKRGLKKGITFKIDRKKYDYRITVKSGHDIWATMGGAKAQAAVFDNESELLFMLSREARFTKGGELNALAKGVVKRLKILSADSTDHGANRDADDPSQ